MSCVRKKSLTHLHRCLAANLPQRPCVRSVLHCQTPESEAMNELAIRWRCCCSRGILTILLSGHRRIDRTACLKRGQKKAFLVNSFDESWADCFTSLGKAAVHTQVLQIVIILLIFHFSFDFSNVSFFDFHNFTLLIITTDGLFEVYWFNSSRGE